MAPEQLLHKQLSPKIEKNTPMMKKGKKKQQATPPQNREIIEQCGLEIADVRHGWIFKMTTTELKEELEKFRQHTSGNTEEMRERLLKFLRHGTETTPDPASPTGLSFKDATVEEKRHQPKNTTPGHPIGEILNQVRNWNLRFNGNQDQTLSFLERLEELQDAYNYRRNDLLRAMPELLTSNALLWFRNNKHKWANEWAFFEEDLRKQFLPHNHARQLEEAMRNRHQKTGEPVKEFVTEMQTLARRLGHLTYNEEMERIYRNLSPTYKHYVRPRDFHSIEELTELAVEFEQLQGERNSTERTGRNQQNVPNQAHYNVQSTAKFIQNFNKQTDCSRCGSKTHTSQRCNEKYTLFCWNCGKIGTKTIDCHPYYDRQGNEQTTGNTRGNSGRPTRSSPQQQTQ